MATLLNLQGLGGCLYHAGQRDLCAPAIAWRQARTSWLGGELCGDEATLPGVARFGTKGAARGVCV